MSSTPLNGNFSIQQQFTGNDGKPVASPFVLPPNVSANANTFPTITVNIDNVAGQTSASCNINTGGANNDFQLSWNAAQAVVTVSPTNVWAGDAGKRAALRASFDAFRQQLETLELTNKCLKPGGAFYVAQRVAESLPLTLDESLYFRYSFDKVNNYIDLQPGMRLRVEYASYQFIASAGQTKALNGYAGNGVGY